MVNWDFVIEEDALASVLPVEYRQFARPIRDGLTVFLQGLPEQAQASIVTAQAALPVWASVSERLALLARSCPVLHKLGQILSRDQRLSTDLRRHLQELEWLAPTVPLAVIQSTLQRELGPLDRRGVMLQPPAIAEASVAVVIPFLERTGGSTRAGVFKILKPGIEERLELELVLLERVGVYLDQRCEELHIPHLDYETSFQQVKGKLVDEVRLRQEQQHLVKARTFFADEPDVLIPAVFEHCTDRVTAMQRIAGRRITDHGRQDPGARRRLATLVAKALIAKPIFARDRQALFHADPHAGNLLLCDDGRLAILDWSLVGTLGKRERIAIVQILLGAVTLHEERIVALLGELAERPGVDRSALRRIVANWLRRVRQGQIPGLTWLLGLLDDAAQNARLRVASNLMLFRKSLYTLAGVLADVGPQGFDVDTVLTWEFLRHWACEWPQRWFAWPESREFATGLSTLDLARAWLSGPATVARFWVGQSLDLLNTCSTPKMEGPQRLNVTARRMGRPIPQPTSRGTSAGQTGVMHDVANR